MVVSRKPPLRQRMGHRLAVWSSNRVQKFLSKADAQLRRSVDLQHSVSRVYMESPGGSRKERLQQARAIAAQTAAANNARRKAKKVSQRALRVKHRHEKGWIKKIIRKIQGRPKSLG